MPKVEAIASLIARFLMEVAIFIKVPSRRHIVILRKKKKYIYIYIYF